MMGGEEVEEKQDYEEKWLEIAIFYSSWKLIEAAKRL
jgi:hypothetical protein